MSRRCRKSFVKVCVKWRRDMMEQSDYFSRPELSWRLKGATRLVTIIATLMLVAASSDFEVRSLTVAACGDYIVLASATASHSQDSEDTVQITIRDEGFDPAEVRRDAGKFLLTVDDRRSSTAQRLTLRLSRGDGELVREIEVPEKATDWAEEIDLQTGEYAVSEVNHTTWVCRIIVR